MVRNESIDVVKGFLIVMVIIGHILLGTLDGNVLRYLIYSFHMPAFFFISGYLLNLEKIQESSPNKLLSAYWNRMLLQWLVALLVYSLFLSIGHFSIKYFLLHFIKPYYHLWYVPTLFSFITITKLLRYIKKDSVFFVLVLSIGLLFDNINLSIFIGDFRLNFYIFFAVGLLSRYLKLKIDDIRIGGGLVIIFVFLLVVMYIYKIPFEYYAMHLRLACLVSLCMLLVLPLINKKNIKSVSLSAIGRNSLQIYLWHVLPIVVIKHFLIDDPILYYALSFAFFAIVYVFIWKFEKMRINKI